ncbi:response regulator [Gellertiella hungarica]|uniref:CheY-like chemotaxis protein n=1 Tax=Gellertiella hungarica TaxID=1572859 RepID=A0A7W6J168_9HYPH|nr:response regulator [Gellertiella hungarica]MBB4062881.1 CheY-like chemotaxis protein [Gellertiella hungarica]
MNILIVEDEALLALELQSELEEAGHHVTGHAMSMGEAVALAEARRPDFAFVDIHLRDGPTGIEVGRILARDNIPFVFVTGNLKRIPEDFAGAIEKPYSQNGLHNALAYISALLRHADWRVHHDPGRAPPGLVPAPACIRA